MDKIGRIYGEVIGDKFTFATKKYFEGDFVKILDDEKNPNSAELIGEIVNRGVSNKFITTPEIVKYLDDKMDFRRDTIYTYSVDCIGVIKDGKLVQKRIAALPGKNVYSVKEDALKIVYGIEEAGQKIGYLKKMPICGVTLDTNLIFNPHLFVVGKTGSGKSYFMKNYISKIEERFWIFSPSNEYDDIITITNSKKNNEYILDLSVDNISYYVNLNASEELILRNVDFQVDEVYSYKELVDEIYQYYRKKKNGDSSQLTFNFEENNSQVIELPLYANSLIGKLKNIRHLKFTKNHKLLQLPKNSMVFDVGEYTQLEQECILNYYLYKLLQSCKKTKMENRKKQIVIIEEAHNYVPSVKSTLSKEIIVRLSREGRKYGVSLCFITQRPRFFDQTALSQSGNKIIFSLSNPDDIKHIIEDIPFYKSNLLMEVQSQKTGECIIAGDAYNDILEVVVNFNGTVAND